MFLQLLAAILLNSPTPWPEPLFIHSETQERFRELALGFRVQGLGPRGLGE